MCSDFDISQRAPIPPSIFRYMMSIQKCQYTSRVEFVWLSNAMALDLFPCSRNRIWFLLLSFFGSIHELSPFSHYRFRLLLLSSFFCRLLIHPLFSPPRHCTVTPFRTSYLPYPEDFAERVCHRESYFRLPRETFFLLSVSARLTLPGGARPVLHSHLNCARRQRKGGRKGRGGDREMGGEVIRAENSL